MDMIFIFGYGKIAVVIWYIVNGRGAIIPIVGIIAL